MLGLEDTGALMHRLGKSELCWGEQMSVDDMLARIAAVTPDDVREVARDVLGQRPSLAVIGPLNDQQADRAARGRRLSRRLPHDPLEAATKSEGTRQ